jgi:Glyoxalase-like domain
MRMGIELDHLFVCTAVGAPEAEDLVHFGLLEGPPNQHPGQGTANRRFGFKNAMIELLWVNDAVESQSELTRRTQLWERWSGREGKASPFGVCLRPVDDQETKAPFAAWEYRPAYLPDPLVMHIGEAGIEEPMWVYLDFLWRADRERWFAEHPIGIREITGLTLISPASLRSNASRLVVESGTLSHRLGPVSFLEIEFDGHLQKATKDFRPRLPLVFKY